MRHRQRPVGLEHIRFAAGASLHAVEPREIVANRELVGDGTVIGLHQLAQLADPLRPRDAAAQRLQLA
jgi:hypothetical protein